MWSADVFGWCFVRMHFIHSFSHSCIHLMCSFRSQAYLKSCQSFWLKLKKLEEMWRIRENFMWIICHKFDLIHHIFGVLLLLSFFFPLINLRMMLQLGFGLLDYEGVFSFFDWLHWFYMLLAFLFVMDSVCFCQLLDSNCSVTFTTKKINSFKFWQRFCYHLS